MRHARAVGGALGIAVGLWLGAPTLAAEWPDDCKPSTLPSDDPDYPDDQLVLICLPSDFNGTLIVYAHGYVKPEEPLALPKELGDTDVSEIIERLLDLGFGVATSSYHKNGYAIEQAAADLNDLVEHVKSSEPDVDTVYVVGGSEGGLVATMLVEQHPEIYDGGLAMCGPLAGVPYQVGYTADVRVLFDSWFPEVFDDPEQFPFAVPDDVQQRWVGADGWKAKIAAAIKDDPDATAQLFEVAGVDCNAAAPNKAANCAQDILAYSVFGTNDLLDTAGGWPVSNAGKKYKGSADDAALNAGVQRFEAAPDARSYARRYYRTSGKLKRDLVTLHTTQDPIVPYRHEEKYLKRARQRGKDDRLTVLPVDRAGHCAFEAQEVVGGLAALLLKAQSPLALALMDPLKTLRDAIDVDAGTGRLAELVQKQARAFVDEVDALSVLDDASDSAKDVLDDAADSAEDVLDEADDLVDDAKDKVKDLF
jgi:pimeloyl-ACP methyl ester carboxylesterase